jgi:hypothetical protein
VGGDAEVTMKSEEHMNRRIRLTLALLLLAVGGFLAAGPAYAADPVNNNLDATAVSATWTIDSAGSPGYKSLLWQNLGMSTVYVCIWRVGEVVAACTTALGTPVLAAEKAGWGSEPDDPGIVAATYICEATQTSDNNSGTVWGRAKLQNIHKFPR